MLSTFCFLLGTALCVSEPDSLPEVCVKAERRQVISRVDTLEVGETVVGVSLSDFLFQNTTVMVNDYGGVTGTKNLNIRGMGSTHTSILVDGVKVENTQSGQLDLNMLDLSNFQTVLVDYTNQTVRLLSRNVSREPCTKVGLGVGSWNTRFVSFASSFTAFRTGFRPFGDAMLSDGDFHYGHHLKRENNDLRQLCLGTDVFGKQWQAKVYYNGSTRGCPGSLDWPAFDRQKDRNLLGLFSWRSDWAGAYSLRVSSKGAYDRMLYKGNSDGYTYENDYRQKSLGLYTESLFKLLPWWNASVTADVQWCDLKSDVCEARRTSVASRGQMTFLADKVRLDVAVQYSGDFDRGGVAHCCWSPSVGIKWAPGVYATIRRSYRVPVFNDLYYVGMGNPNLKPEDAWENCFGIDVSRCMGAWKGKVMVEGFYNHLENKIISAPTEDPYLWTMYNLGEAQVYGIDSRLSLHHKGWRKSPLQGFPIGLLVGYTLQNGTRIAYQSRHALNVTADAAWQGWIGALSWSYRGSRPDSYGTFMPPYHVLNLSLTKQINRVTLSLRCRNLLNRRYQVINGYPMEGISFVGGLQYKF